MERLCINSWKDMTEPQMLLWQGNIQCYNVYILEDFGDKVLLIRHRNPTNKVTEICKELQMQLFINVKDTYLLGIDGESFTKALAVEDSMAAGK